MSHATISYASVEGRLAGFAGRRELALVQVLVFALVVETVSWVRLWISVEAGPYQNLAK